MNKIYVDIDFNNGTLSKKGIDLISGDYASTEIEFTFEREDGRKVFEMKSPSGNLVYADEIVDNKVLLTAKDENENNVSLFDESGDYIFEVSLYVDNSKLTSVYGKLPVQKEQVEIEGEVVEKVLPLFEQLMQELDAAITQTDNLNIDGNKSGKITTITITYKDGTTKELQLEDGKSIEYNWQGTQLGIRQEGQSEYVYVDLKGEKGDAGAIKMLIVAELPETGQDDTIYLVPIPKIEVASLPATGEPKTIYIVIGTGKRYIYESEQWLEVTNDNNYFEYVYINNKWEELGEIGVQVDLTDYVKNTDYATSSTGGVIKSYANYNFEVNSSNGLPYASVNNYDAYVNRSNNAFISKGTLENVITGKGLVSNTDYASSSTGGVVKIDNFYGLDDTTDGGKLRGQILSYANYQSKNNFSIISKGTLENVLTERIGSIADAIDLINGESI